MDARTAIKKREEARKLPLGHIGIKKAEAEVKSIYNACHTIQHYWMKRLDRERDILKTAKEHLDFCNKLCDKVGTRHIKKLVLRSPDLMVGTAGHYNPYKKEIHMGWPSLNVLVHELAHHVCYQAGSGGGHGKDFCFLLNWLFQESYTLLKGKSPKTYWVEESLKILDQVALQHLKRGYIPM